MEYYAKLKLSLEDIKFAHYKAMMERNRKDLEKVTKELTIESLNSVDSQGYTLLEWGTVFSTPIWPIDKFLKKRGAQIPTDEGLFRQNVFFIALQYLRLNNEESKTSQFLSFDGIDIHGVNQTRDTALHLALYGEKKKIAEKILNQFPDFNVNVTNFWGDTPLHLAVKFRCKIKLIKKILARMNSENVNKHNKNGDTALHVAIQDKFKTAVNILLKRKDVDVSLSNKNEDTAFDLCRKWKDIPDNIFKIISDKTADIQAQ
jgi:ankyrin repeat protein